MTDPRPEPVRDWLVVAGLAITALAAAISSFAGLRALAVASGYPGSLAWIFPLCVDAYGLTSTRVWLARSTRSRRARRFAALNAGGAICLSLIGNGLWHLIDADLVTVNWIVVVFTAAVPPAVLGAASHLIGLRHHVDPPAAQPIPDSPHPAGEVRRHPGRSNKQPARSRERRSDKALLAEAQTAYAAWHANHGREINRDELRRTLKVSSQRATDLLRRIKAEQLSHVEDVVNSTDDNSFTIRDN